jgi:hypothetical protein
VCSRWTLSVEHSLWTFTVTGDGEFELQPPGNPIARHDSGLSVFHFMLTDTQAQEVKRFIQEMGLEVKSRKAEGPTDAQTLERRALLGKGREGDGFPSTLCPACYWFDPTKRSWCGATTWPNETIEQSLESHQAARDGKENCPVKEGRWT